MILIVNNIQNIFKFIYCETFKRGLLDNHQGVKVRNIKYYNVN